MLFKSTDMKKFQKLNVHHILYKCKHDLDCPFLNIRISMIKADFTCNYVKVQVLDFVFSAKETQRLIAVSNLQVLAEVDLQIPKSTLEVNHYQCEDQLPLNLSRLIIKRAHKHQPIIDFKIFYLECNIDSNDPLHPEFLGFSRIMKNTSVRRKSSKKQNKMGLNFMLNAIRQFKNADEMKRKMIKHSSQPIKEAHNNEIQEYPEFDKSDLDYSSGNQILLSDIDSPSKPNILIEKIDDDLATDSKNLENYTKSQKSVSSINSEPVI